jgi:hypothetical protein
MGVESGFREIGLGRFRTCDSDFKLLNSRTFFESTEAEVTARRLQLQCDGKGMPAHGVCISGAGVPFQAEGAPAFFVSGARFELSRTCSHWGKGERG